MRFLQFFSSAKNTCWVTSVIEETHGASVATW